MSTVSNTCSTTYNKMVVEHCDNNACRAAGNKIMKAAGYVDNYFIQHVPLTHIEDVFFKKPCVASPRQSKGGCKASAELCATSDASWSLRLIAMAVARFSLIRARFSGGIPSGGPEGL